MRQWISQRGFLVFSFAALAVGYRHTGSGVKEYMIWANNTYVPRRQNCVPVSTHQFFVSCVPSRSRSNKAVWIRNAVQERNICLCTWWKGYSWQPCVAQSTVFKPTHFAKSRVQNSRLTLYLPSSVLPCSYANCIQLLSERCPLSESGQWFLTALWHLPMHFSKSRRIMRQVKAMMCNDDISIARFRLPSEEQVQVLAPWLLQSA